LLISYLGPFFTNQRSFDVEDDSDDAMDSQNEDDQPIQDGSKDSSEGELLI
jgi:hypothetical protein